MAYNARPEHPVSDNSRIAALMDIGTYSIRLLLVKVHADGSWVKLSEQKETVRLGDGEFREHRLQTEAMSRAALVCGKFAELARSFGANEIIAVATASSREAKNKAEFLRLLKVSARVDVRIISGREEARLIYLGVSSGVNLGKDPALFIDIGGGSAEVIIGNQQQYQMLDSLKLGAIRVSSKFFDPEDTGPVSRAIYGKIQRYVRNTAIRTIQRLKQHDFEVAIGSSGTIVNLAEIATHRAENRPWSKDDVLTRKALSQVAEMLCELPLKERKKVPGINPNRADIIIGGAAVIETLMEELDIDELRISERGLRDGLLIDYLSRRRKGTNGFQSGSIRERSVLQLGRLCNFDERHARNVARLALELYDSARESGLHELNSWERELLEYAALLHDIGSFLSYNHHHAHSHYFIRNADLLGFDQTELEIMANAAFFHHKAFPDKNHLHFATGDERARRVVVMLSVLLRIAESLDRGHLGVVRKVRLSNVDKRNALLLIETAQDSQLEVWGVHKHLKAFKRAFDKKLKVEPVVIGAAVAEAGKAV